MATALERAVQALGSQSAFARFLGVSQPSVWAWLDKGKPLPAEHVLRVEAETGITRYELRPDLYPVGDHLVVHAAASEPEWPIKPARAPVQAGTGMEAGHGVPFGHASSAPSSPTCSPTSAPLPSSPDSQASSDGSEAVAA